MEVAKAGEIVGKVAGGNTGILSRYGIVTTRTRPQARRSLRSRSGSRGRLRRTARRRRAALSRAGVASENLGEVVGAKLTPFINSDAKAAGADAIGDGVGRITGRVKDASAARSPQGGAFGGSLMGARPSMKPFAAIGSRFGLHVSVRPASRRDHVERQHVLAFDGRGDRQSDGSAAGCSPTSSI
jgi:hypothetical protein